VSGSEMTINLADLLPVKRMLDRLSRMNTRRLLDQIGGELEAQTRERLSETKTAPDGEKWASWSPAYAAKAKPGAKLLEREGTLLDSIAFEVGNDAVTVGSNMVYAATHQFGRGNIPARPFLGVSAQNIEDIGDLVMAFIAKEADR
jgi:phage virion morphogenesis protein